MCCYLQRQATRVRGRERPAAYEEEPRRRLHDDPGLPARRDRPGAFEEEMQKGLQDGAGLPACSGEELPTGGI